MTTPADVFDEINGAFQSDPARAQGIGNAVYAFDVSGDGGGPYHIVVEDGVGEAGPGAVDSPQITIAMDAADLVDLRTGKLDGTMAFMSGKIKIKGDMGLAMKLQTVLR